MIIISILRDKLPYAIALTHAVYKLGVEEGLGVT